jgi:lipopolysaccharide transport system ATP-binding protein
MLQALKVHSVSKAFRLYRNRPVTLKESLIRRVMGRHDRAKQLWALRDISFSLAQGRSLGIIGHNGAGKSTLLRLICGLGRPTSGAIFHMGFVSGLLELGSGFHADMTGRENIMTGGLLSGFTAREAREQEQEIIAFAELEDFIDQPIRTYSSGMYLRLAFATAMQFNPSLLVIDEILAVGDVRFQQKCLQRLATFRAAGKTLILTSHSTEQIRALCDEVLVLDEGRVVMQGDPDHAIQIYNDLMRQRTERRSAQLSGMPPMPARQPAELGSRQGTQEASISEVQLYNAHDDRTQSVLSGERLTIDLEYSITKPVHDLALTLGIYNAMNMRCFETAVPSAKAAFGALREDGRFRCQLPELPLLPGRYYINVGLYPTDWSFVYDYHWQMHELLVVSENEQMAEVSGVISLQPNWSVERPK